MEKHHPDGRLADTCHKHAEYQRKERRRRREERSPSRSSSSEEEDFEERISDDEEDVPQASQRLSTPSCSRSSNGSATDSFFSREDTEDLQGHNRTPTSYRKASSPVSHSAEQDLLDDNASLRRALQKQERQIAQLTEEKALMAQQHKDLQAQVAELLRLQRQQTATTPPSTNTNPQQDPADRTQSQASSSETPTRASTQHTTLSTPQDLRLKIKDIRKPPTSDYRDFQEWFGIFKGASSGFPQDQQVFQLKKILEDDPVLNKAVAAVSGRKLLPAEGEPTLDAYLEEVRVLLERRGKQDFFDLQRYIRGLKQEQNEGHGQYKARVQIGIRDHTPAEVEKLPNEKFLEVLKWFIDGFREPVVRVELYKRKPVTLEEAVNIAEQIFPSENFVQQSCQREQSSQQISLRSDQQSSSLPQQQDVRPQAPRLFCGYCKARGVADERNNHSYNECRHRRRQQPQGRGYQFQRQSGAPQRSGIRSIDTSPLVLAMFGPIPVLAVVDTGAFNSCLSYQFVRQLKDSGVRFKRILLPQSRVIHHSNGNTEEIQESISVPFRLGRHTFYEDFYTVSISEPCILGDNFLHKYKCRVDYRSKSLLVSFKFRKGYRSVPIPFCKQKASEGMIARITAATSLAPLSITRIQIPAPDFKSRSYIVSPQEEAQSQYITESRNGMIPLFVENTSVCRKFLDANSSLGRIEPIAVPVPRKESLIEQKESQVEKERHVRFLRENLDLGQSCLSAGQQYELRALLEQFATSFSTGSEDLGRTNRIEHEIDTQGHPPMKQTYYRSNPEFHKIADEHVAQMLKDKVVVPSASPWASPVVIVPKKDGTKRFCVDYRRLNAVTRRDSFPLPRIDDLLQSLNGSKFFSSLDAASGYWQIAMAPRDQEKTAFVTRSGLFEFTVMPFGLTNAPATFQRLMNVVLEGLIGKACLVYIDDVLVIGKTFEEHQANLQAVLQRLKQANIKLKLKKCHFAKPSIQYLGHVISQSGVSTDPEKIQKIKDLPAPENLDELRSFIGIIGYYQTFDS